MATIYKRPNSPFWWLGYTGADGRRKLVSTKIPHGDRGGYRRALDMAANLQRRGRGVSRGTPEWTEWVPEFIESRYREGSLTRLRMTSSWKTLATFFHEAGVQGPAGVTREHCFRFLSWRKKSSMYAGTNTRPVRHNTALADLKILRILLNEAKARGLVTENVAAGLKIRRERDQVKDEMTDAQINTCRSRIAAIRKAATESGSAAEMDLADFFHVSFEIALHQCCRMCETYLPISDIDFEHGLITVLAKGGEHHTTLLNPDLAPLLLGLKQKGCIHTYKLQKNPSIHWFRFFAALRRDDPSFARVSFHSLRVTGISRLSRAGVKEAVVMRLVNHSSSLVHRIYRRTSADELHSAWGALRVSDAPGKAGTPTSPASAGRTTTSS